MIMMVPLVVQILLAITICVGLILMFLIRKVKKVSWSRFLVYLFALTIGIGALFTEEVMAGVCMFFVAFMLCIVSYAKQGG